MVLKKKCGQLRHDELVEIVKKDFVNRGIVLDDIATDVEYRGLKDGQIDLYAKVHNKYILLVEVKCTYSNKNKKKADEQTTRAVEHYFSRGKKYRIFRLMSHYDKNSVNGYKIRWLKSYNSTQEGL